MHKYIYPEMQRVTVFDIIIHTLIFCLCVVCVCICVHVYVCVCVCASQIINHDTKYNGIYLLHA